MSQSADGPKVPSGRGGPQRIPRPEDWHMGGPPPWAHLSDRSGLDLLDGAFGIDRLVAALRNRPPRQLIHGWRDAPRDHISAVLVAVFDDQKSGPKIILTKRAARMRSHRGELAFPGGRRDEADPDLVATALREAEEEIGLDPATVDVIGQLDRFVTGGSNSLVHPVVATLNRPPEGLVANPDEVDQILVLPVTALLHPDAWREELWPRSGQMAVVTFFELPDHTLWGATALMVRQLLAIWLSLPDPVGFGPAAPKL